MKLFNLKKSTVVSADTSSYGLGADMHGAEAVEWRLEASGLYIKSYIGPQQNSALPKPRKSPCPHLGMRKVLELPDQHGVSHPIRPQAISSPALYKEL